MNNRYKFWGLVVGISGFLSVGLGAFGAHGLKSILTVSQLATYHTAVDYHVIHTLSLGLAVILGRQDPGHWIFLAMASFAAGILLFSGSLYILALSGLRWLGMITPIGGLCLMAGWLLLGIAFFKGRSIKVP